MIARKALQLPVLVLNTRWVPVQVTTVKEAIGLVAKGSAKIIDLAALLKQSIDSSGPRQKAAPAKRPKVREKPDLRVVGSSSPAAKAPTQRKRA